MKTVIELLKITAVSLTVGLLVFLLKRSNDFSCGALDAFIGEYSLSSFFETMSAVIIAATIWIMGVGIYYIVKRVRALNLILYFFILTVVSLYHFIFSAMNKEPEVNREITEVICDKGSDNGMECRFTDLSNQEYNFINSRAQYLPIIPVEADSVNIYYYRDDFLGDFHLIIELTIPSGLELDTVKFPKWKRYRNRYQYEDFQT